MNIKITTFRNPFSFFCVPEDGEVNNNNVQDIILPENGLRSNKFEVTGVTHGQYVAVLWQNHWVRGIVSLETHFLIWLVDYGIYLRANEKIVYVNLPSEEKKLPTKVFEASIHGCTPLEKQIDLSDTCQVNNAVSTSWCNAAVERAQDLISKAVKIYFIPIAIMSTKINDVVIGNLYLQIKGQNVVNLIDELEKWPVFLKRDPHDYIENLSKFYTTRRQHRASMKMPALSENLPIVSLELTISDYTAICAVAPELTLPDDDSDREGSTHTYLETTCRAYRNTFKPTPEEMERYANIYITISGREYNVLNLLLNKARDLYMCEIYANQKGIGRATSRP